MARHQRDDAGLVLERIPIGDLLQKLFDRRLLGRGVVLARDVDELLEVLKAALGLDRALGLECLRVPRLA